MRLTDEVLIQIRITSDDLDGHTLSELSQLLIALVEVILLLLRVLADIVGALLATVTWLAGLRIMLDQSTHDLLYRLADNSFSIRYGPI